MSWKAMLAIGIPLMTVGGILVDCTNLDVTGVALIAIGFVLSAYAILGEEDDGMHL